MHIVLALVLMGAIVVLAGLWLWWSVAHWHRMPALVPAAVESAIPEMAITVR